jgi:hypothetical protein
MRPHEIDDAGPQAAPDRTADRTPERPRKPGELQRRLGARGASARVQPTPIPNGRVVGRFRSRTLDWVDPDSGEHLRGRIEAPDTYLEELSRIGVGSFQPPGTPAGDRASRAAPPDGRTGPIQEPQALGRGSFWVRVSPGIRLPRDRIDL